MKSSNKISGFFSGAWAELKKVAWPTRKETLLYTITVIAICLIVATYLGLFDMAYLYLLQKFVF